MNSSPPIRHAVPGRDRLRDSARDLPDQFVADRVPERVVGDLQVVDVYQEEA